MIKAITYLLIFVGIQIVYGSISEEVCRLLARMGFAIDEATTLIIVSALARITALVVFLCTRWAELSRHWIRTRPWFVLFWCVLAAFGAIIPSSWIQEQMPELPDWAGTELDMIMGSRAGYFIIGLLSPFAEEVVFRGAILRALLDWKKNPWIGIVISAVIFSAVHMNPAQMPHAFLIGLLIGWMYYRTNSIIPGVVYHWVNNTIAYVLFKLYPNSDPTLLEIFDGSQRTVAMALFFSLCILIPSILQLNIRMKR